MGDIAHKNEYFKLLICLMLFVARVVTVSGLFKEILQI